jgi:hypothetical protein
MNFKVSVLLVIAVLIPGCGNRDHSNERFSLIPSEHSLSFSISPDARNLVFTYQYFAFNDTSYLAILNEKHNSIEVFDLKGQRLSKVITMGKEGANAFTGVADFIMLEPDTVLAIRNGPKDVAVIDGNGRIVRKIPFSTDSAGRNVQSTYYAEGLKNFLIGDEVYLGQDYRMESVKSLSSDFLDNTKINVVVNTITGDCISSSLTYPVELTGKDVSGMKVYRDMGPANSFIYHFGLLNSLFVTYDHKSFSKVVLDTNYKLDLPDNNWEQMSKGFDSYLNYYLQHDEVINIHYDKYRENYFLIVRLKESGNEKGKDVSLKFLYPHCIIIILDKKLSVIGETILPDNFYSCQMMFVAPEGLYISEDHPNNPNFSEDYMRFRLFKLVKQ